MTQKKIDFGEVTERAKALAREQIEGLEKEIPGIKDLTVRDLRLIENAIITAYHFAWNHGQAGIP